MNLFLAAVLKIVIAEAFAGLLIASFFFEKRHPGSVKAFTLSFALVAAASVVAYFNFGFFRYGDGLINVWEQYHFFLGSKYLPEVGYDNLYRATVVAVGEEIPDLYRGGKIRQLATFEMEPASPFLDYPDEVRNRFTPERWNAFSNDLKFFSRDLGLPIWDVIHDHGNTGSPAWAAAARLFIGGRAANRGLVTALSFLDVVLLAFLFTCIGRIFSLRVALIGLTITMLVPRAYDFLGGSILRLDWLFALGMCACMLRLRRPKSAGAFLAWAIASKPFCALFALGLGLRFVIQAVRAKRIDRFHVELVAASLVTLVLIVVLSAAVIGDAGIWKDYVERILVNLEEKYYAINYSFRDVFLQVATDGPGALFDCAPETAAASRPEVFIEDFSVSFIIARILALVLLFRVAARYDDDVMTFSFGAFFVWVVFVTNMYYWQMLLLPALAFAVGHQRDWRKTLYLVFLAVFLIVSYIFVQFGNLEHMQGYFGSWLLNLFCLVMVGAEAAERKFSAGNRASPSP